MQLNALQWADCAKIFADKRTGATTQCPALTRCLKAPNAGDTLIVRNSTGSPAFLPARILLRGGNWYAPVSLKSRRLYRSSAYDCGWAPELAHLKPRTVRAN